MTAKLYLRGYKSLTETHVVCPLPSSCILFFLRYCQTYQFEVVFIKPHEPNKDDAACSEVSLLALEGISVKFVSWDEAPPVVRNVCLPSVHQPEVSLVRAGLCVVLRHIIKTAHAAAPEKSLIDLLGFRQGSMRMCSEVSGWTKLCEVDLCESIALLIQSLKVLGKQVTSEMGSDTSLPLPLDLLKLEGHFKKKCRVHNDDKRKRAELSRLKKILLRFCDESLALTQKEKEDVKTVINCRKLTVQTAEPPGQSSSSIREPDAYIENISYSGSHFTVNHVVVLPHGVRRVRIEKELGDNQNKTAVDVSEIAAAFSSLNTNVANNEGPAMCSIENKHLELGEMEQYLSDTELVRIMAVPGIAKVVEKLTYHDVEYVHTYSEGAEITLADLILFVYIYFFLEQVDFDCRSIADYLPSILHWAEHMVSLPTVALAGRGMGWDLTNMATGLKEWRNRKQSGCCTEEKQTILFTLPEEPKHEEEDEMELSRCARMKHKAIKPEVFQTFKKLEEAEIKPCIGEHPRGEDVTVSWDTLPASIHPREGDVPEKRTRRKCQQLENLVTAVQAVAKPGDAVIDFCSGGGHLGIVLAYLLPHCQVYLVENKEESLLKVCSRLESLALRNVTLYQCNIDYFIGKFDVGVCLHACGSATDMVQQLCLNAGASFVICPCCYGSIHNTHLLTYPRSKQFQSSSITYKDFLTLGHAADQTEFNIALEGQGRECMNLVDSDRAAYAREFGYQVTLCSLNPLSCTPKNNLLVGVPA